MRMSVLAAFGALALGATPVLAGSPVGPSPVIAGISWGPNVGTFGPSGDAWATTMRPDGRVETAWGDGVVGCATKVNYGTGHLPSSPGTAFVRDGCGLPGIHHGKITSLLYVGRTLWAILSTQQPAWPHSAMKLMSSADTGAHWTQLGWSFPDAMKPIAFVQNGPADGHVYLLAQKPVTQTTALYLARVPTGSLARQTAYQYFTGTAAAPAWGALGGARPVVAGNPLSFEYPAIGRIKGLGRYLLTTGLGSADSSAVLDAPNPWGPFTTVEWKEPGSNWLGMADGGERQTLSFPYAWQSSTGKELVAVWGCWSRGAGCGAAHNDKGNVTRATLTLR